MMITKLRKTILNKNLLRFVLVTVSVLITLNLFLSFVSARCRFVGADQSMPCSQIGQVDNCGIDPKTGLSRYCANCGADPWCYPPAKPGEYDCGCVGANSRKYCNSKSECDEEKPIPSPVSCHVPSNAICANSRGEVTKDQCGCTSSDCQKDTSIDSSCSDGGNWLCVEGDRDDCCSRGSDNTLGQCLRLDFGEWKEIDTVYSKSRIKDDPDSKGDLDVYAYFSDGWHHVGSNLWGEGVNCVPVDGRVRYVDFCIDHADNDHEFDWIKYTLREDEEDEYEIDVYDVRASPDLVEEGEDVSISGMIKLKEAPSGSHEVTVKWYVDDSKKHEETIWMHEDDVNSVSWDYDTDDLSDNRYDVKIKAFVDSVSDYDTDYFYVGEGEGYISLGDLKVDPDSVCVSEHENIMLSVPVTLERGSDDTLVTARFYVEDDGYWDYIDKKEIRLDEDETRTFRVYYDYDSYDLDEGWHDVKVVVEARGREKTGYDDLYVSSCIREYEVSVGWISLDPEHPEECESVTASVPVTLNSARDLPIDVYVKGYVDNDLVYSTSVEYYSRITKTFKFIIDTCDYSKDKHTIKVHATIDGITDVSKRTFIIGEDFVKEHCLSVDDIWVDDSLIPGEEATVHVEVSSCGTRKEYDNRVSLKAFSDVEYDGVFDLSPGESEEVTIEINVPEDAEGTETFEARVWNSYVSDTLSKSFTVFTGVPVIDVEREYKVKECEVTKIAFDVINAGEATDTFTLKIKGDTTEWFSGIPQTVTLEPDERKTIKAYVSVPCDTEPGRYAFTVSAEGSQKYSVTSYLVVVKPWAWPVIDWTGLFVGVSGIMYWLAWVFLSLFLVLLVLFLFWLSKKSRRGGAEGSVNSGKIPLFDSCC